MNLFRLFTLFAILIVSSSAYCQPVFWSDAPGYSTKRNIDPLEFRTMYLNLDELKQALQDAPSESETSLKNSSFIVDLPLPNGSFESFKVLSYNMMEKGLSKKFPQIKTFIAQGIDSPTATARLDYTANGFHAIIRKAGETVFIDPYNSSTTDYYLVYTREAFYKNSNETFNCAVLENGAVNPSEKLYGKEPLKMLPEELILNTGQTKTSGSQLRTYRLAVACTGEYAAFHGGTVLSAMSAITTSVNRVNGIYENEAAVRMVLVANNDLLVFLNSGTDPYTNGSGGTMLGENISTCNSVIGSANYDIGHVFSTGGGGVAYLGVPCGGSKAGGVTGSGSPVGDPFDVDYIAHEMGHQFGANHTQNNSCNRASSAAYEPGSASTIMGYAGICSPNIQSNSDDHFHAHSHDEIVNYTTLGNGNSCPVITATGNAVPVADAGVGGFTIPNSTPFELTGNATDGDNDPLTYRWEQHDLGPATAGGDNDLTNPSGNAPIFRSFSAVETPTRIFPKISDIVNNVHTIGEWLPTYSRNLNFRFTALDNQAGTGGLGTDEITFSVDGNSGPFEVTLPNTFLSWGNNSNQTVGWNVANTDVSPVSCAVVDIFLSIDGGYTYPYLLASNVPNTGSVVVTVPNVLTSTARVKVKAADNVFFDISNSNFEIITGGSLLDTDVGLTTVSILSNICGSSGVPSITFTNLGINNITQVSINYGIIGETVQNYVWTGTLTTGQSAFVDLPLLNISGTGTLIYSASIIEVNNVVGDENSLNDSANQSFYITGPSTVITLSLTTDCWGEEVSWFLEDDQGTTIAASSTTYGDQITVTEDICVGGGCYTFNINDSYGDGLAGTLYSNCGIDGDYEITDDENNILVEMTEVNYGTGTSHDFCIVLAEPVIADFTANLTTVCEGESVQFTDQSSGSPNSWTWTLPGGIPVVSGDQNPLISYNTPGTYAVGLSASNGTNTGDTTAAGFITVLAKSIWYLDSDGDGFGTDLNLINDCNQPAGYVAINGDCNDGDPNIFPGAIEICDGIDNNCNDQIDESLIFSTYYPDSDGDNYGDVNDAGIDSCLPISGMVSNNLDCDDLNIAVNPDALEQCDGLDNNCNGQADEGLTFNTYYADVDNDGFGDINGAGISSCLSIEGYVTNNTDCDDGDSSLNPATPEICDGIDNNCDGQIDESLTFNTYYVDVDNDGFGDVNDVGISSCLSIEGYVTNNADCDDDDSSLNPATPEICDGIDNNCDGQIDEGLTFNTYYVDVDNDGFGDVDDVGISSCLSIEGYVTNNADCDDGDSSLNPATPEICDGIDNNCDGQIDESLTFDTYYVDYDNDGFGDINDAGINRCIPIAGFVTNNTDCNDGDSSLNPGELELCDGVDNNCDGQIDEGLTFLTYYVDVDNDGFGDVDDAGTSSCMSIEGYVTNNTDCDDGDSSLNPATPDICDGIDNDCDGQIDEGLTFVTYYVDIDSDGFGDVTDVGTNSCLPITGSVINNTDCNDGDSSINPDTPEICDGIDNNCDGQVDEGLTFVTYYVDIDSDGFGDANDLGIMSCEPIAGFVTNNTDCNDGDSSLNPATAEICDGIDNNCDGQIDEDLIFTFYYIDGDNDGFGDVNDLGVSSCSALPGHVSNNADCDDSNESINPEAPENCDGIDNNCNGTISDEVNNVFYVDSDGDGFGDVGSGILNCAESVPGYSLTPGDCDDQDETVYPNAIELCDNIDNNCDGQIDEGLSFDTYYVDSDNDGYGDVNDLGATSCLPIQGAVTNNFDCDDLDSTVHANAIEICDGQDNDCNGQVDEDLNFDIYYIDSDSDGFGDANDIGTLSCSPILGSVTNNIDCNDQDGLINPSADETCDGLDNNCNGQLDEGLSFDTYYVDNDNDGYGDVSDLGIDSCLPILGTVTDNTDCNDLDENTNSTATEVCDGVDNNCDGVVDEGCSDCVEGNLTAPINLSSTTQIGGYILSWDPVPNSIVCQIKGGPLDGTDPASVVIWGDDPFEKFIDESILQSNFSYQWKVRCACSTDPLVVSPFSEYDFFTTPSEFTNAPEYEDLEIVIYPNPASSNIFFEFDQIGLRVEVYDILGDKKLVEITSDETVKIEVEKWPSGYYVLKVTNVETGQNNQTGFIIE